MVKTSNNTLVKIVIAFFAFALVSGCKSGSNSPEQELEAIVVQTENSTAPMLMIDKGNKTSFRAIGVYDNGKREDISNSVSWHVDDDSIAIMRDSEIYTLALGKTSVVARKGTVDSDAFPVVVYSQEVLEALKTGDASLITDVEDLLSYYYWASANIEKILEVIYQEVFPEGGVSYSPGRTSKHFAINNLSNVAPLIIDNSRRVLATLKYDDTYKAMAFGRNIIPYISNNGTYGEIEPLVVNATLWLVEGKKDFNVALVNQTDRNFGFYSQWFESQFSEANVIKCSEIDNLTQCISDVDLIVTEDIVDEQDIELVVSTLENELAKGRASLLYSSDTHSNIGYIETALSRLAGVSPESNYWSENFAEWNNWQDMFSQFPPTSREFIQKLSKGNFSIDFTQCDDNNCDELESYQSEFFQNAEAIRRVILNLDKMGVDIFDTEVDDFVLEKVNVLLGDKFREVVNYPMDKNTTDVATFLRALYADFSVKYVREHNAKQSDLGIFQPSKQPMNSGTSATLDVTTQDGESFHQVGVYALPGETFSIKRTDVNPIKVSVFINTLYNGSTLFETNGYSYPSQLRTPDIETKSGETMSITSPYGGPVHIRTYGDITEPVTLSFEVEGVASDYPFIQDFSQQDEFRNLLNTSEINWSGIKTDFVQVISTKEKMQESLDNYNGDVEKFFSELWEYTIKGTYNLAGFSGNELSLSNKVSNYCASTNIDCTSELLHSSPSVQHILVAPDMTGCWGCSGNPYRQSWALEPLGWGETHEIGHNLQTNWTKIYSGRSGEVSNNIFPMKAAVDYFASTGTVGNCERQSDSIKRTYNWVQTAQLDPSPLNAMYEQLWDDDSYAANNHERLDFYFQLVRFVEHYSVDFDSGWDLFTILYLHERLIKDSMSDESTWTSLKNKIGLENINLSDLDNMTGNDFILITLSNLVNRDFRDVFSAWGISHGSLAETVLTSKNYSKAELIFFKNENMCLGNEVTYLPIDGTTAWR